jgi:hypothetical protein
MSSNQIGGFFNRLEASRKYLFGSMGVLGVTENSIITGTLIARGSEIQPVVGVAPDWESYSYERIDLGNPEHKKFFEAALAWDLEVGDKKWVDGKNVRRAILPYLSTDNPSTVQVIFWSCVVSRVPLTSLVFGCPNVPSSCTAPTLFRTISLHFCPVFVCCHHYLCMSHLSYRCIV